MKNKILICLILCVALLCSSITVFATENGDFIVNPNDKEYVQDEDGNWVEVEPTEPEQWDDIVIEEDPNEGRTEEDIYNEIYGDGNNNNGSSNTDNNSSFGDYTDIDVNVGTGEGVLTIIIDVPEDFKRDVLVELYERSTGNIVKIPVYAINKWQERTTIPAGNYMVYNVLAGDDDALNPEYPFEVGKLFTLKSNGSNTLKIKNQFKVEEDNSTDNNVGGTCTDTEMKPEDLMTDEEIEALKPQEELTVWQHLKNLALSLVSGPNLFLLAIGAGLGITYYIYKKRQDED